MNRPPNSSSNRFNDESLPLISIITAVYNAQDCLGGCIQSVISQNYKNFEYIIIDGGSSDSTVDIIKQYKDQLEYWISEPDTGIYDAWNKGLKVAKGDWIAFIGADDLLNPDAFQVYIDHINAHPNRNKLEFVSSLIELVTEDLSPIRVVGGKWEWDNFRVNMITWHVGCFHSKHLFDTYGIFDSSYKVSGDYELLLRPREHLIASFIPFVSVQMRTGGVSHKLLYQAIKETYRAKITNGVISPGLGFILSYVDRAKVYMAALTGWK